MERDVYQELLDWKGSSRRKPLVVNGARQVGKTHALQAFGTKYYENCVYVNFEKDDEAAGFFEKSLDPKILMEALSLRDQIEIHPGKTLLIFDEIQDCPRALVSLKYFCEEAGDYHVAAAGSLLGVKVSQKLGFPVGKVNFIHMYPLSFFEFLSAIGQKGLREYLENLSTFEPIMVHDKLIDILKRYFFVGGMPEVVAEYAKHHNLLDVREIQGEILKSYEWDFAKHAPSHQVMKIFTIWNEITPQLAKENKKFIYAAIKKSARARDYEEAIQWLLEAGLIHKCYHISKPSLPLSHYADREIFKLFLLDVGLVGAQAGIAAKTVIEGDRLFTEFKGALTENFVAQELITSRGFDLYYWTSSGTAELDFVIQHDQQVYPLEVKAGVDQRKKSLNVFGDKYSYTLLSRSTLMNLKQDGAIRNYPLYLVSRFPMAIEV